MWSIIVALISSVIGAFALQKARYDQNHSGAYSIGGYIAFIISFAMLEYTLIFMNLAFVFAVWGAALPFFSIAPLKKRRMVHGDWLPCFLYPE